MRNLRKSGRTSLPDWGRRPLWEKRDSRAEVVPGAESPSGGVVSGDPPGNNRESCFLLKLAKLGTQILEKRTTPDFKKFSLEKNKMKKQNENKIKKNFVKFGVVLFSTMSVSISTEFSGKQSSQAIMKNQGGVISSLKGVVSSQTKSRGCRWKT